MYAYVLLAVSFGAGVALRMAMFEVTPSWVSKYVAGLLKDIKVVLPDADELAVRSGGGVGDCGGGVFRSLFGVISKGRNQV